MWGNRRLDRGQVREVDEINRGAEGREVAMQQFLGHRIHVGRGGEVAAAGQEAEEGGADGSHASGGG